MPKNKLMLFCVVISTVLSFGCQSSRQQPSSEIAQRVLAKVNGTPITIKDVDFQGTKFHNDSQKINRSLEDVVNQELLYQQGIKLGLDKDPGYRLKLPKLNAQPAEAKRIEMARRVFNTQIASRININFQDAKSYFKKNENQIMTELHLELLRFGELKQAEEALAKIKNGAPFEKIARSLTSGAMVGGCAPWDLGFVKWEDIPIDFVAELYKLKPGEVSEILGSRQAGFQIVKLVNCRKASKISFDSMQGIVMNRLRDLKLLEAYGKYVAQLRKDARIELL